uniref:ParB-like N-terminal domain-containing protein n=1 Tax=uncultured organism CA37 TaxID=941420 RepID=E9L1J5_9ZZZZ|nr:hypothetical protein CA37-51 [uncultured organism CA37]
MLLPGNSPRQTGEDAEHTELLAKVEERLPPIIVHRPTMRVIDGSHRVSAARLRGDRSIEVRFFEGTEQEAFVLAVEMNVAHGLPLSLGDRTRAAERILASYPSWSNRAIASATALGARTVGNIRRRLEAAAQAQEVQARTGRDGRVRPLDGAQGRLRAFALLRERPEASLREIAREVGVSPSTVLDVRRRVEQGADPVPDARRRTDPPGGYPGADTRRGAPRLASILDGLQRDPSLRLTESGRTLLRWIHSRAIRSDERASIVETVPPHCAYLVADIARACAGEWTKLAGELERRTVETS